MRAARVAIAIVLVTANAFAQPNDEDKALALTLFRRGRELMDQKRTDEACASFAESQRLDPGGGTLLNLALCHEAQGRTATAWAELSDALVIARRDQRSDRIDLARAHIEALEPKLSRLAIVPPRDANVRVVRNGSDVPRAAFGVAVPVDPGKQIVDAFAGDAAVFHAVIEVLPDGDRKTLEVVVTRPPPPVVDESPKEKPARTRAIVGWSLVGAGALSIGTGAYFGVRAIDERSASDAGCRGDRCSSDAFDHHERAGTYADVSTTTIGLGAVALAAGLVLLVLDR